MTEIGKFKGFSQDGRTHFLRDLLGLCPIIVKSFLVCFLKLSGLQ